METVVLETVETVSGVGAVRGKKCEARRAGQEGRGMALVERSRAPLRQGRAKEDAESVADARTTGLCAVAEPLARPRRS